MIRSTPPPPSGEPPSLGAFAKAFAVLVLLVAGLLVLLALTGRA